jgi:exopolysaccharide production protein ExoQ
MPPPLASLLYTLAIIGLLVRDVRRNPGVSHAIWVPLIWFLIIGSRMPTIWLTGQGGSLASPGAYIDGSPIDRVIFLALMALGAIVLVRRSIDWSRFFTANAAITIFFAYGLVSLLWSDFPLVAFKRWHKVVGHLIMAMVILTDPQPTKAFISLFKRCAYVLLPLSVLFIKYYSGIGRGFDLWSGAPVNFGVATTKNELGSLCLVLVAIFPASWFSKWRTRGKGDRIDRWLDVLFLGMTVWLLKMADSTAATAAGLAAVAIVCSLQIGFIRRQFTVYVLSALVVGTVLLATTDIKNQVILALGEDTTLTGRTDLWEDLERVDVNPIVGVGFESFWVGPRIDTLWEKYWWHPNQAHNGYYETYLNLGGLGLLTLAAVVVSCYWKARKEMLADAPPESSGGDGRTERNVAYFRVAFLFGILAFNLTDATFKALHPSFFAFFVVALGYRPAAKVVVAAAPRLLSASQAPPKLTVHAPVISPIRGRRGPWVHG